MAMFRASKINLSLPVVFLPTDPRRFLFCSFFLVCASMILYVAFVVTLFVPHFSFTRYLGRIVLREYGISCVFSLTCLKGGFGNDFICQNIHEIKLL